MPIDPSIYFNRVQPGLGAQHYANQYLAGQGQSIQNQQGQLNLMKSQQDQERQQSIQAMAQKYQGPNGFDQGGFINEYSSIDPMGAQQLHQKMTQESALTQKMRSDAQKSWLEMNDSQRKESTWHAQEAAKALDAIEQAPQELRSQLWDRAAQKLDPGMVGQYENIKQDIPLIKAAAQNWSEFATERLNERKDKQFSGFHPTEGGDVVQTNALGEVRQLPGIKAPKPSALVNVGVGTPVQGVDASGNPVFFQANKAGGAAEIIPNVAPAPKAGVAKKVDPAKMDAIISSAEALISKAPGSYAGAAGAEALKAFGVSNTSTQSQAKLRSLQAQLMMNMPRMEGPQSDKDVALYREQAGRIGDPTIPAGDKLAALAVIKEINNAYKQANAQPGKVSGGVKVWKVKDDKGYDALPKGAHYTGPDGIERVK